MSNEAAERMEQCERLLGLAILRAERAEAALGTERLATVARIRAAVVAKSGAYDWTADEAAVGAEVHDTLFAILDAEAAR